MPTLKDELTDRAADAALVDGNPVANFSYTPSALANKDITGHSDYDPSRDNNIPLPTPSALDTNVTVLNKGFRSQAASITRNLMNHFFGRASYNLNMLTGIVKDALNNIKNYIGQPGGVAELDAQGRVPYSQLPESSMTFRGSWDASTNTPALSDSDPANINGDTYVVTVAGTQDLGHGSITFQVNDRVVYSSEDGKFIRLPSGSVSSVNGVLPVDGDVTLTKGDIGLGNVPDTDPSDAFTTVTQAGADVSLGRLGGGTAATIAAMTGCSANAAGKAGLVPQPAAGQQDLYLRADGTWASPANTTYALATSSANGLLKQLPPSSQSSYYLNGTNGWALLSQASVSYAASAGSAGSAASATNAGHATEADYADYVWGTASGLDNATGVLQMYSDTTARGSEALRLNGYRVLSIGNFMLMMLDLKVYSSISSSNSQRTFIIPTGTSVMGTCYSIGMLGRRGVPNNMTILNVSWSGISMNITIDSHSGTIPTVTSFIIAVVGTRNSSGI